MNNSINLTLKERKYLNNLLNNIAIDFSQNYNYQIYEIQEKLNIFPKKQRTFCPICQKTMIQFLSTRKGKVYCNRFSCSKKCQKVLDSWRLKN